VWHHRSTRTLEHPVHIVHPVKKFGQDLQEEQDGGGGAFESVSAPVFIRGQKDLVNIHV
jgi:hypothetical protein